jgi:hypothetical protein
MEQCSDTNYSWREIARSNQKRGKQADEHGENQHRMNEQPNKDEDR